MAKTLWRATLGETSTDAAPWPEADEPESPPRPRRAAGLPHDTAQAFRLLGVDQLRASVVDIASMAFESAWTVSADGEIGDEPVDQPLDGSVPAAVAAVRLLADAGGDETLLRRLSPRRWGIAWRLDAARVVLAEAGFVDRRDTLDDTDKALLRLVCDIAMLRRAAAGGVGHARGAASAPRPEAGASNSLSQPASASLWRRLSLTLALTSALLAAWLAGVAVPAAQHQAAVRAAQVAQGRLLADRTLVRGLAAAMAGGDYGEVQSALSTFASLGYFQGAAVLNPRERVVALAGRTDPLRIGDVVPATASQGAKTIALTLGAEPLGGVLILPAVAPAADVELPAGLTAWAIAAALAATAAAACLLLGRRRLA